MECMPNEIEEVTKEKVICPPCAYCGGMGRKLVVIRNASTSLIEVDCDHCEGTGESASTSMTSPHTGSGYHPSF